MKKKKKKFFIITTWALIFSVLKRLTVFYWLRLEMRQCPVTRRIEKHPTFVEVWVLVHLLLSAIVLISIPWITVSWLKCSLLVYGALRVFESVHYQLNVILFDRYRAELKSKRYDIWDYLRTAILSLHTYVEFILWYGAFYLFFKDSFKDGSASLTNSFEALRYSFHTMSTFGAAELSPENYFGKTLLFSQSVVGLIMVVVILARFLSLVPPPELKKKKRRKRPGGTDGKE